jgi:RNA polymerase sigma factor (sigma-70 family)
MEVIADPIEPSALDQESLAEILGRLRPRLCALFARFRLPPEDAEDLMQNAVLRALVRWSEIHDKEGWLYGTVLRMCRGAWRSAWKRDVVPMDPEPLARLGTVPPAQERRDLLTDLDRICQGLPNRQRQVLVLRYHFGFTDAEIAPIVGVRPISVRKIISRATGHVCQVLGGEPAGAALGPQVAGLPWPLAVHKFLAQRVVNPSTRRQYSRYLDEAGAALGCRPADLTVHRLAAWRAALVRDGRSPATHTVALCAMRTFLVWVAECDGHGLEPQAIRAALRQF